MPFAQERMGFDHPPRLFLRQDTQNADNPLGKTAFYDPQAKSVTLYTSNRHPKDVMRSLSHELVHHKQNCDGQFENVGEMGEGYAQNNVYLRGMESEAYQMGNMCFRDWEDSIKGTIYNEHLLKGVNNTMSIKNWKNRELTTLLSEAWGFGFDLSRLNEAEEGDQCARLQKQHIEHSKAAGSGHAAYDAEEALQTVQDKMDRLNCPKAMEEARKDLPPWLEKEPEKKEEKEETLDEMCPDMSHGAEEEMGATAMVTGDEEEGDPGDPSAIVDELSALLARLQAALGGEEEEEFEETAEGALVATEGGGAHKKDPRNRRKDDPKAKSLEEDKLEEQVRKVIRRAMQKLYKENKK